MNKHAEARALEETADVLTCIGRRIRQLRTEKKLTLQALGERTGLSTSMLSLLERGKTGPSIGTLVVIASALEAQMSDLLRPNDAGEEGIVASVESQREYETAEGVVRRILKHDRQRGVEIAINEYAPGTANSPEPHAHGGFEYGILLDGSLKLTVDGRAYTLKPGDLICYRSTRPHKIANSGETRARTLWINLKRA
jgi:transcriptional regulator with XRE-family HTH domain